MQNKFPGTCTECGSRVPAQMGEAYKTAQGWKVRHEGACPTEAPAAAKAPSFTPTAEQAECVRLFATGENLVIQAGAGAGKTSTLLLIAAQAGTKGLRGQYCAYNASIVADVAAKMPGHVNASTMHSLAYRALGYQYRSRLNAPRQRADETAALLGVRGWATPDGRVLGPAFLASQVMGAVRKFCNSADSTIGAQHFAYVEGLDPVEDTGKHGYKVNNALTAYLLPYAKEAWEDLTDPKGRLRFSHDVYLKLWQLSGPRINADFVLLDEAQDADPVQVEIIKHQLSYGTQVVVVGDEMQVLYEWRGAVNALADFEAMGANVAFLSQSFRFGDAIAEVANGLLDRLGARLRVQGFGPVASVVGPVAEPDAILCRTNAGAVSAMLAEISAGRRPHLVGGGADIVAFCKGALELQQRGRTSHFELACFDSWTAVQDYVANDSEGADLKLMVKLIDKFGADTIRHAIEAQPQERDADIVLSTAHKSKGREWAKVQIASDFQPPKDDADMSPAELRLAYVAVTRAKHELDITAVPHFCQL